MFGKTMMILWGKKESIAEQHETKFKRTFLFTKNNMSPAVTAWIVTTEFEDGGHLHLGRL